MKTLALAAALAFIAPLAPVRAQEVPEDVKKAASCPHCGMDRAKFAHSRMVVEYEDGSSVGTCSIRCAAVDLSSTFHKAPKALRVGDAATRKLIDAEKASWVLGGSKPGVMTRRAKWAFETPEAAQAFAKENGGTPATFEQALQATYEDLYGDDKMLRERRKAHMERKAQEAKQGDAKHGETKHGETKHGEMKH